MASITQSIKAQCRQLRLSAMATALDNQTREAEQQKITYLAFLNNLLQAEINQRMHKDKERRQKQARLPLSCNLEHYDYNSSAAMEPAELKALRELRWVEQNFNLILMGPSGTGKTFIAAGLCFDAVEQGYRACFQTIESLLKTLRMKDITKKAAMEYKRITNAHLLVIDDIMMLPLQKTEAVALFNLINEMHEKASLIITTNKAPKQWVEILQDEVLTTAILDRILYRCEIIKLEGKSYRMQNRKSIFEQ